MALSDNLNRINSKKKIRFVRTKTWFSWLMSNFFSDLETPPRDIGDRILILNNRVLTKRSVTAYIEILDYGMEMPGGHMSALVDAVTEKVPGVTIDHCIVGESYKPDTYSDAANNRYNHWTKGLSDKRLSSRKQKLFARLIYSFEKFQSGEIAERTYPYIKIRSRRGKVSAAVKIVEEYLISHGATIRTITSDLQSHFNYSSLFSRKKDNVIKDSPNCILSAENLAELLPYNQGSNDDDGIWIGLDVLNGNNYLIDTEHNQRGKNILLIANTGYGKTKLALFISHDAYLQGYDCIYFDIKGSEFIGTTEAMGGITLSVRASSDTYINTFRLDSKKCGNNPEKYFSMMFNLSKKRLSIVIDDEENNTLISAFLEQLLKSYYTSLGVAPSNPKTFSRSKDASPYDLYRYFKGYVSNSIRETYAKVIDTITLRFEECLNPRGSRGYLFRKEYNLEDILDRRCITFDWGMLLESDSDPFVYKLKLEDVKYIKDEYSAYKASLGEKICVVLEETEIISDDVWEMYVRDATLRRAQGQVSLFLGNSMASLQKSKQASMLIDCINFLLVGEVNDTSREYIEKQWNVKAFEKEFDKICAKDIDYENVFLLINRIQNGGANTLITAPISDELLESPLYKPRYEDKNKV